MAVIIKTDDPSGLLSAIKKAIDEKSIETWSYDGDGDFTHTPDQWKYKAWLYPKIFNGELRFGILGTKSMVLTKDIIGIYHGRFIEMLITHFGSKFVTATATSKKMDIDIYN